MADIKFNPMEYNSKLLYYADTSEYLKLTFEKRAVIVDIPIETFKRVLGTGGSLAELDFRSKAIQEHLLQAIKSHYQRDLPSDTKIIAISKYSDPSPSGIIELCLSSDSFNIVLEGAIIPNLIEVAKEKDDDIYSLLEEIG